MSIILGLNAFHPGASAALIIDGQVIAAIAEERLCRIKYYGGFPNRAIQECLKIAGVGIEDIEAVAIGRDSAANRYKKIHYAFKQPTQLLNFLRIKRQRQQLDNIRPLIAQAFDIAPDKLKFRQYPIEHHLAHTASAYFSSHWDHAAGITIDGSGDFVTCMMTECRDNRIDVKHRIYVPHSLGSLYFMVCQFIGYDCYGDEGKVMGLAPYGTDTYREHFNDMLELREDDFRLNLRYFIPLGHNQGMEIEQNGTITLARHYSDHMVNIFGPPREPEAEVTQRDCDLAYGVQALFEKAYLHLIHSLYRKVSVPRVVLAGGCVLNSVANGKLFDHTPFEETSVHPASGDDGLAVGAALYVSQAILQDGPRYPIKNAYLGPDYSESEIESELERQDIVFCRLDREQLLTETTKAIARGLIVGWFQGRMEWGPRALGNRSILAHPGLPQMKDTLNARIKQRESFRPFAPSVLDKHLEDIFINGHPSPFMLHVATIKPEWRERLCAVTHTDGTGRLQTVSREENPLYYDLIRYFEDVSGLPVLLNTSFNENEPIVLTPQEAIDCYKRTRMDVLAIGPFFCRKTAQH